jgi:hypothetical protein
MAAWATAAYTAAMAIEASVTATRTTATTDPITALGMAWDMVSLACYTASDLAVTAMAIPTMEATAVMDTAIRPTAVTAATVVTATAILTEAMAVMDTAIRPTAATAAMGVTAATDTAIPMEAMAA